jgi:hypothetical protein
MSKKRFAFYMLLKGNYLFFLKSGTLEQASPYITDLATGLRLAIKWIKAV